MVIRAWWSQYPTSVASSVRNAVRVIERRHSLAPVHQVDVDARAGAPSSRHLNAVSSAFASLYSLATLRACRSAVCFGMPSTRCLPCLAIGSPLTILEDYKTLLSIQPPSRRSSLLNLSALCLDQRLCLFCNVGRKPHSLQPIRIHCTSRRQIFRLQQSNLHQLINLQEPNRG
jgi:hypothetical protein